MPSMMSHCDPKKDGVCCICNGLTAIAGTLITLPILIPFWPQMCNDDMSIPQKATIATTKLVGMCAIAYALYPVMLDALGEPACDPESSSEYDCGIGIGAGACATYSAAAVTAVVEHVIVPPVKYLATRLYDSYRGNSARERQALISSSIQGNDIEQGQNSNTAGCCLNFGK